MSSNPYTPPPVPASSAPAAVPTSPTEPHVFSPPKLSDVLPPGSIAAPPTGPKRPVRSGPPTLADRLQAGSSGVVYDVMRELGHTHCVLPQTIRPIDKDFIVAGRIYTVSGHKDMTIDAQETLLAWSAVLSKAPVDTVVICQPHDSSLAHFGEMSAETFAHRGIRGYIVDGGCRDGQSILRIGFPVWCRYFTPIDIVGRWVADIFGEPFNIGGVQIRTGDYVIADFDGIVIVPADLIEEVVARVETKLRTEDMVRKAILAGDDPQEAYLRYRTL